MFTISCPQNGRADLVVNLSGTTGSTTINYSATGSVTVLNAAVAISFASGTAPVAGVWDSTFDNDIGDILSTFSAFDNDDLPLSGGGVSYRKNDVEFGVFDTIDLDPSETAGADDIEFDLPNATPIDYPALMIGDVVSWVGSGTFVLDSGTFDTIFTTGTYSNSIDGGSYIVNVTVTPVPEPSAAVSLWLVVLGVSSFVRLKNHRNRCADPLF